MPALSTIVFYRTFCEMQKFQKLKTFLFRLGGKTPLKAATAETDLKYLLSRDETNTEKFSLATSPMRIICKCVSVYDGDTCDIIFQFRGEYSIFRLRLNGLDTEEMHPLLSDPHREEKMKKAKMAKSALEGMILNKIVYIEILGNEKYGRLLGNVYVDKDSDVSVSDEMISSGHGVFYDGGKKLA